MKNLWEPSQGPPGVRSRRLSLVAMALLALLVGVLDWVTGIEVSFSIFYLFPVGIAAWRVGPGAGRLVSILCALIWLVNDHWIGGHEYSAATIPYWNAVMRLGVFLVVADLLTRLKAALIREHGITEELRATLVDLDETRKQQLVVKDQILSHVSHELRTPLTAVLGFLQIVLDGIAGQLSPPQREYLKIALRNATQLNTMIQDLLDATRVEAGRLRVEVRPMDVGTLVEEVLRTLRSPAAERRVDLTCDVPGTLPQVLADPARVRQVLVNLVDNALKFAGEGGRVSVKGTQVPAGEQDGEMVRIAVSDTGPGIRAELQPRLFQRLSQVSDPGLSRKGLGLGLFISRDLVTRQGGRIWVEPCEPGRGATFCFTLPVCKTEGEGAGTAPGGPA